MYLELLLHSFIQYYKNSRATAKGRLKKIEGVIHTPDYLYNQACPSFLSYSVCVFTAPLMNHAIIPTIAKANTSS